jgi:hypothetical protein
MPKSSYLDTAFLNVALRNTAYTAPTTVYTALFNGIPGGGGTEASGGSYARQATAFVAPSSNSTSNSALLTFTNMPALTVNYVAIYDALTAGNLLYYAAATAAKTTNVGDTVTIAIGGITVAEA